MFLVGAGCSVSAGIPLASEVAKKAVVELAARYRPANAARQAEPEQTDPIRALVTLVDDEHFPAMYRPEGDTARWGNLYSYIFSEHIKHPNEQRDFIARMVDTKDFDLNWSHACLGELVKRGFVHTVLTTNFDQLVLKGIIRTGIVPVVADGLESLSRISATPRSPQVVHVHGSLHTYELRNSYESLRETQDDRGLQSLMLSILKETTVLVVVGYAGGEEGIMRLLQDVARALPRMVVYWIAFENDYIKLSNGAKSLLELGEYKYFILNQDSDDFFNQLLGELGVGPPGWIDSPLEVLRQQVRIKASKTTSEDVRHLIAAYYKRVRHAIAKGTMEEQVQTKARVLRSANRFKDAADELAATLTYRETDDTLRLHALSLTKYVNGLSRPDVELLRRAIGELQRLVDRGLASLASGGEAETEGGVHASGPPLSPERGSEIFAGDGGTAAADGTARGANRRRERLLADTEALIEARRDLYETFDEGDDDRASQMNDIAEAARSAQAHAAPASRGWAVMEFYKAEALQLQAEVLKRQGKDDPDSTRARSQVLNDARASYEAALPVLSRSDVERARECKEGLAGALSNSAELLGKEGVSSPAARSYLRQAKALFSEVIEFSRRNTPGRELAGSLENLADVAETIAKWHPEEARTAREEAMLLLQETYDLYIDRADIENAARVQKRIAEIRSKDS